VARCARPGLGTPTTAAPFIQAGLADGSYRAWLAEENSRAVAGGGVAIVGFQPHPRDPRPRRAWILNMYTEPECQRRGLARQLLEALGFKATNEKRLLLR
jgi:GNAT superfamily N-acetyltransferase